MFREIKLQAKKTFFSNSKMLIAFAIPFMVSNFVTSITINYLTSVFIWSELSDFFRLITLLLLLSLEFVFNPLSVVLMFKTIIAINTNRTQELKYILGDFFKFTNIKKIIVINLIPRLLATFFDINGSPLSQLNAFHLDGVPLIVLSLVSTIISNVFFACNYCFALNETSIKDTVTTSFKIMKKLFWKNILLCYSFIPWAMLVGVVNILLKIIINIDVLSLGLSQISNIYTPFLDSLGSLGYGIDFYLIPYIYLTIVAFIDGYLKNANNRVTGNNSPLCSTEQGAQAYRSHTSGQ